ncbi:phage head spike fiber domain-containing protein [Comamonas testosteroni]|nr:hypothetical protein [Comamonas testosteroni]
MTTITDFPAIRPSFLLDFANSGRVDPRISCVRASTATCCGPDGKRRTVASNVPRIDYDPATGKCLGLLVEEARTNHCIAPNNLTSSGAWILEGACSAEYFAADGGYSVLSVTGATYTARPASPSISTDLSMAISCEVKRTATSQKVYVQRNGYVGSYLRVVYDFNTETVMLLKGGEAVSSGYGAVKLEDGWVRIWVAGSVRTTEISTNQQITLGEILPGQSVAVRRFQMETGDFPTSYIPTAGTAVTRAADLLYIDYTLPTVGAIVASVAGLASANTANAYLWSAANPADTNADHAYTYFSGSNNRTNWWVNKGGVGQSGGNIAGRPLSIGMSFDATGKAAALAAGSLIAKDTTRPRDFPANLSRLSLGRSISNNGFLGGCISRLAVYSGRITDAQLQRLTA